MDRQVHAELIWVVVLGGIRQRCCPHTDDGVWYRFKSLRKIGNFTYRM
ncbi:MAG: hypothetical protein K2G39_05420 [Lachnospiraceae bacterium]|nr:hypothetical protein [Lachnospiraceae bacterium]